MFRNSPSKDMINAASNCLEDFMRGFNQAMREGNMLFGNKRDELDKILAQAKMDAKGNYSIYHQYRRKIEDLDLDPKSFEQAVRKLASILRV